MIVERTLSAVATAAAVAAAVGVSVIAGFYAVFVGLSSQIGPAWAAVVIWALAAITAWIIAAVASRRIAGSAAKARHQAEASIDSAGGIAPILLRVAKERPILSAGAAVAVGLYALRNPALISAVLHAFVDQPGGKSRKG